MDFPEKQLIKFLWDCHKLEFCFDLYLLDFRFSFKFHWEIEKVAVYTLAFSSTLNYFCYATDCSLIKTFQKNFLLSTEKTLND